MNDAEDTRTYHRRPRPLAADTRQALQRVAPRSASVAVLLNHIDYLEDYIQQQHDAAALGDQPAWTVPGRERIG